MAVTDIAPTTLSLVVGVNVTLKVALWPGAKLKGRPRPLAHPDLKNRQICPIGVGERERWDGVKRIPKLYSDRALGANFALSRSSACLP